MLADITVDPNKRFLRLKFGERATIEDWRESIIGILHLSQETGIRHVLVDIRSQLASADVVQLHRFASSLPIRIVAAVLTKPDRYDHQLVETVAVGRGMTARLFYESEEEAVGWLEDVYP